jgi:hypothetical protein
MDRIDERLQMMGLLSMAMSAEREDETVLGPSQRGERREIGATQKVLESIVVDVSAQRMK